MLATSEAAYETRDRGVPAIHLRAKISVGGNPRPIPH